MAEAMEEAGKAGDVTSICENTETMLEKYLSYITVLQPFCEEAQRQGTDAFDEKQLLTCFQQLHEAIEDLDMDAMEAVMEQIESFGCPQDYKTDMQALRQAVDAVDGETCETVMEQFREKLKTGGIDA